MPQTLRRRFSAVIFVLLAASSAGMALIATSVDTTASAATASSQVDQNAHWSETG
jgi:hypothetical protein